MAKNSIGTAYVQIIPSSEGIQGELEKVLAPEAEEAGEKAGQVAGEKLSSGISSVLSGTGKIAATIGTVVASAVSAAAVGIGAMTKAAVEGYGEFEQLQGGVQKLYGEGADQIMDYANKAYETAGMSANKYLETATSFSASLINSLGGDTRKAADQTDVAMRAISDNVNTFGSDIESVTNAFQGFSKQNYTMLDNLKLGYGGTKAEMERLIEDANEWGAANGAASDLSIDSFSDVVTAIEQIQHKQGIAGTTAKEAAATIEGSLGMLSASWENLLTGIANPDADLGGLIDNLVSSAESVLTNLMPVIGRSLEGIGTLIENVAPIIGEKLPELAEQILPNLLSAATSLITELVVNLPDLIAAVLPAAVESLQQIWDALLELGTELTTKIQEFFGEVDWGEAFSQGAEALKSGASTLIGWMVEGFDTVAPDLLNKAAELVDQFSANMQENLPKLAEGGGELVMQYVNGISAGLPNMITAAGNLINSLLNALLTNAPQLLQSGMNLTLQVIQGISQQLPAIAQSAVEVIGQLLKTFLEHLPELLEIGISLIGQLAAGLIKALPDLLAAAVTLMAGLTKEILSVDWIGLGVDIINGIIKGLKSMADSVVSALLEIMKAGLDAVKKFFGIASPSKLMETEVGEMIPLGIAKGIEETSYVVKDAIKSLTADAVTSVNVNALPAPSVASTDIVSTKASTDKLDAIIGLMAEYYPEFLDKIGTGSTNANIDTDAIDKALGLVVD